MDGQNYWNGVERRKAAERCLAEVAAKERERCAKVCEMHSFTIMAKLIRAIDQPAAHSDATELETYVSELEKDQEKKAELDRARSELRSGVHKAAVLEGMEWCATICRRRSSEWVKNGCTWSALANLEEEIRVEIARRKEKRS